MYIKNEQVCDSVAYVGYFESTALPQWRLPDGGTQGVPTHLGGNFVHLLCIYPIASEVGFVSWFPHYAWYKKY